MSTNKYLVLLAVLFIICVNCVKANLIDEVLEKACTSQSTYPLTSIQSLLKQLQQTQVLHEQYVTLHKFIEKENSVSFHWSNVNAIVSLFDERGRDEVVEVLLNRMARLETKSLILLLQQLTVDYSKRLSLLDNTKNLLNDFSNDNKNLIISQLFNNADYLIRKYAMQILDFTPNCVFGNIKEDNVLFMITNFHYQISAKLVNNSDVTRYTAIKQILRKTLSTLKPTQRFDVMFVGYFYDRMNSQLTFATKENVERTIAAIESCNKESVTSDNNMFKQFTNFGFPDILSECNYQQVQSSAIYYLGMTVDDYGGDQWTADLIKKANIMNIPVHTVAFELGTGEFENEAYKNRVSRDLNLISLANKGKFIRLETR